ncbi:MAG TPA: glycoside hydrolase family 3 N-terminal domain-containing protein [Acidobacteriaceae bacterium]|jgi:beta-glucosidase
MLLVMVCGLAPAGLRAQTRARLSNRELASPAVERRVNALLARMTLEEKLGQLVQYNGDGYTSPTAADTAALAANPQANYRINSMQLAAEGKLGSMLNVTGAERTAAFQHAALDKSRLHIPLLFGADVIHGYRTIYPVPLGLAASFDPEMVRQLSHMSAQEASTAGIRWFYSPMVDISRDARWGRTTEGAGEDAYLGAAMARAYIRGYQGDSLGRPDSVAASVKHFAAYGAAEAGREYNTTDMSTSRLLQDYLPPYKAAVDEGAATMMSAFNALNGVPATANPYLLDKVLRRSWGFNGFVVSDYTSVMELMNHGIALDPATATEKAIKAGVDVDMMSHFYDSELPALVRSGRVPMSVVDEAVRRVLRVKFALGLFEHPYPTGTEVKSAVAEHRPLVRQAAEESFVLLQNNDEAGAPVLPLKRGIKVALIGPLADESNEMQGAWGGGHRATDVVTLKGALEEYARTNGGQVSYAAGTTISGTSDGGFAEAEAAARSADVVVLAMGESSSMSGEAGSRAHLTLPGNQQQLLERIAGIGKPVVLVVFSGRPLVLTWAAQHVPAILEAWFPGTEAGHALARVLFGEVSPSGKLPMSFPYTEGQEPLYYNQFPTGRPAVHADLNIPPTGNSRFISRYIDAPNAALFPFGLGLSYTSFNYSAVKLSRAAVPLSESKPGARSLVVATATVTNTGKQMGTEIVQCYVRNRGASLEQPVRSLQGFARVTLQPGESREVTFPLGFEELSFFTNEGAAVMEPTEYTVWVGGSSQATESAMFQVVR